MSNYETMKSKLEITLSNNKYAIVERLGKYHAIKLTGYDTTECYSLVENTLSPTGKSWVDRDSLYTWALWNTNFIKYVDNFNHSL